MKLVKLRADAILTKENLLVLRSKKYSLNSLGLEIIKFISNRIVSVDNIIDHLNLSYDVEREQLEKDVKYFLFSLEDDGFLEYPIDLDEINLPESPDFYINQFIEDGYFTVEGMVGARTCREIFKQVISQQSTKKTHVHESSFRSHTPIEDSYVVSKTIQNIIDPFRDFLAGYLGEDRKLCELSSFLVFPGAKAQGFHRDFQDFDKKFISVFINLTPSRKCSSSLEVFPKSHLIQDYVPQEELYKKSKIIVAPVGSVTFMNGLLFHRGGENSTLSRIRGTSYFSLGAPNLVGIPYSKLNSVTFQPLI